MLRLLTGLLLVLPGEPGDETWALREVGDPAPPAVADEAWPRGDVDRFVLARLEDAGLAPGPDAAPRALLRRLHFDLAGLPPTPDELAAFEVDPARYEQIVDELLASPRFAERWGRHWLDVARFAESSGGGRSLMFPDAWRYRDWVIDAVEADVPFDRFVVEQLAGDLLPASTPAERNRLNVATGFLLLGPTNYEQQDKELLRLDVIDEQIDTVGRAFLGASFGCARCHDHMFDPVTAEDYTALAGIFGSTEVLTPGNVSGWTTAQLEGPATERWRAHQAEVEALEAELAALAGARTDARTIDRESLSASREPLLLDDAEATLVGEWQLSTHTAGYLGDGYLHDQDTDKGEKSASWTPDLPHAGRYEVRVSWTPGSNRATNVPVFVEHADGRDERRIDQRRPPTIRGWFGSLGTYRFEAGPSGVVTVETTGTDGHVIVDAIWLVPVEEVTDAEIAAATDAAAVARIEARLEELRANAPPAPGLAMTARDVDEPRDEPQHVRGSVRDLGPPVPRRPPELCALDPGSVPAGASGRLELARWIVHPDNPLTARVFVNRVWSHLFGAGLVRTPDDFGARGERPSHPALLDRLARDFVAGGWSTRSLVRRLVLTRAYRLAAGEPPAADPENRLLAVHPLRRLDADALRDAMLATSGELDLARGGSTIRQVTTYDYAYEHDSLRRSVYVPRFRNAALDLFAVFDGPNENMVTGRRGESQVPTQALLLMNSPWVQARAAKAARRVLEHDGDRLAWACELALGRPPTATERELLDASDLAGWTRTMHALLASIDFRYL